MTARKSRPCPFRNFVREQRALATASKDKPPPRATGWKPASDSLGEQVVALLRRHPHGVEWRAIVEDLGVVGLEDLQALDRAMTQLQRHEWIYAERDGETCSKWFLTQVGRLPTQVKVAPCASAN